MPNQFELIVINPRCSGSLLPPEDKKRILVEHAGNLQYAPVVRSFRLLGSKFFNDLQGGRVQTKTKVYDAHITEVLFEATEDFPVERAFTTHVEDSDDLDAETFEAFLAAEDQDALVIQSFEQELEEYLQETPEMHEAMVTYLEARNRLLEKKRSRGFWPLKAKGSFGGSFKGKSKGKGKKQRENLLARIARSYCRKCGAKGHGRPSARRTLVLENLIPSPRLPTWLRPFPSLRRSPRSMRLYLPRFVNPRMDFHPVILLMPLLSARFVLIIKINSIHQISQVPLGNFLDFREAIDLTTPICLAGSKC